MNTLLVNNYSKSACWIQDSKVDRQRNAYYRVLYNNLIFNKREWNNRFIENALKIQKTFQKNEKKKTPQKVTRSLAIFVEHGKMARYQEGQAIENS